MSQNFVLPEKKVKSAQDVKLWEKSEAYTDYISFLQGIGAEIKGKKIRSVASPLSDPVQKVNSMLDQMMDWVDQIKPVEQQQRFGNKAYRDWHARLKEQSMSLIRGLLPESLPSEACEELSVYLTDGFGNATRIDYGTGHEMAFLVFLLCLFKLKVFQDEDKVPVGLVVFDKYMKLCRKLQLTYRMEPAGSQGVWALDDYQFVPFIWGAAQMVGNIQIKPKSIPKYEIAEMLADDYHFFACIKYISEVKTGPFAEHSNQLWNVSGVPNWDKVYQGLIKMYRAEVLSKFPVIQHVFFGSLFELKPSENPVPDVTVAPSGMRQGMPGHPTPAFNPGAIHPGALPPTGIHPGALPPTGIHPGALPPTGVHPGALPATGVHPGALSATGVHPGALPATGVHPGALPPTGIHPGALPSAGVHPDSTSDLQTSTKFPK